MSLNLELDDLGSFDGSDGGLKSPQESPLSPPNPFYNPVGMTLGETSPASPTRSIALSSGAESYGRNQSHSVHGVHMHVQENAKVPLLNQAVDRTNSSSRPSYPLPLESTDNDSSTFSLAELFLSKESKHRQSLNMNYAGLGSLLDDVGFPSRGSSRRNSTDGSMSAGVKTDTAADDDETQMEIDALTAAIDPTPWSEIERKMSTIQETVTASIAKQHQQQPQQQQQQQTSTTVHPHQYSYYPYGRQHQLPIPERIPSPPRYASALPPAESTPAADSGVLAQAVATAAAIASVGSPSSGPLPHLGQKFSHPVGSDPTSSAKPALPYTIGQQTTANGTKKPTPPTAHHYQRHRVPYSPPQHAAAHSTSRASVLAAANKKSQYGFGDNHMVPSVPAPPPTVSTKGFNKSIPPRGHSPPPLPSIASDASANGSGGAYERKKQRAKDARVKLNDAIERLSIAMNLSGSQSKQRMNLLSSRISKTEQRVKSLQISDECVKLAEQAKKWDRPSFVATAASLVQALNSQCESLSRELVCLQERLDASTAGGSTSALSVSAPLPATQNSIGVPYTGQKRWEHPNATTNGSHAKRIKSADEEVALEEMVPIHHHMDVPEHEKIIFVGVARMLDPVSLSRCPCVSRKWRDMESFQDNSAWLQLAVRRFGFYNVRQWTEKLDCGELEGKKVSKKAIYRAMNAANVMPHMQQEGLSLLGDAKIPGRVSGWVFIVERSNGETLRSVKREPSTAAQGGGAYQSRPVVELQIVIQNTGMAHHPIVIKNQQITVDVSTRRSGGDLPEIYWDERFSKVVKALDGSSYESNKGAQSPYETQEELCRLGLFEGVVITVHIYAKGCSTTSKFRQRSNFTKILVSLEGTTVPMVIPFLRDGSGA